MKTERRYDIDWLRVIAIGLLLIYHIAIIFQPWAMLIGFIRSEEPMQGLWKLMSMLNIWRIPLLFYVSGMGVYFAIQKRNWKELLLERSKRILLPFLFGIIAITPLHFLIFQEYYEFPLGYFPHQGHLWFLGNIFAYVLILLPLFVYLKRMNNSRFKRGLSFLMENPVGPLAISLFFVLESLIVKPQVFEMYAETWHGFFLGLLAFFFGFLFVYSGKSFWQTVLRWRWFYLALAAVLYSFRLMEVPSIDFFMAIESNCWIFGIFGLGYKYLNRPGKILSYLSKAAYPVYIVHMFVLYGGAKIILPLEIPVWLKFITICIFTGTGCFLLYEFIIKRVGFLGPFFGLKWSFKEKKKRENVVKPVESSL
jgi:hypothetical protein